mmetsp:Transcript_42128/g.103870  ORF Transcript_42128/g.103870 Transcript_42128/m.103870 type:complete len:223 (-) Transcript_42128:178-846(-)
MPASVSSGNITVASSINSSVTSVEGSSNLKGRSTPSSTVSRPLAPVPSADALLATSFKAPSVTVRRTPYPLSSRSICRKAEPRELVKISSKAASSSCSQRTRTGSRPTNSGSKPAATSAAVSTFQLLPPVAPLAPESDSLLSGGEGGAERAGTCEKAPEKMKSTCLVERVVGCCSALFELPPCPGWLCRARLPPACWEWAPASRGTSVSSSSFRKLFCTSLV